jgi:hypothetical protein
VAELAQNFRWGQKHTRLRLQASTDAGESMAGSVRCPTVAEAAAPPGVMGSTASAYRPLPVGWWSHHLQVAP